MNKRQTTRMSSPRPVTPSSFRCLNHDVSSPCSPQPRAGPRRSAARGLYACPCDATQGSGCRPRCSSRSNVPGTSTRGAPHGDNAEAFTSRVTSMPAVAGVGGGAAANHRDTYNCRSHESLRGPPHHGLELGAAHELFGLGGRILYEAVLCGQVLDEVERADVDHEVEHRRRGVLFHLRGCACGEWRGGAHFRRRGEGSSSCTPAPMEVRWQWTLMGSGGPA